MSAVAVRPVELAESRVRALHVVIGAYVLAAAYHAANSFWHLTPAVFTDELLYSKLAQSVAAGDGLSVRGEPVFFPGLLPVLAQAPAWLIHDAGIAYAIAKVGNAVLMSAAVFPAYWLARQLLSPWRAMLVAVLTAASPALLYHDFLMSEALAYPVFLTTLATMTRALARPSRGWDAAAVAMALVAVLTRVQFVALPVAYVVGTLVVAGGVRAALRRHRISLAAFGLVGALGAVSGGAALGPYIGAALLDYNLRDVLHWGGLSMVLVLFGWAWFLTPGVGLGLLHLRRTGFGAMVLTLIPIFAVEIALVSGGQAMRPLERYGIYLAAPGFVAFLAYTERGAPWRRAYAALAVALGLAVWLVPFPTLAPGLKGYNFSFDSPTLSAYGSTAVLLGHPNASTIFCGGAFVGCLAAAAIALRGRSAELLVAPAAVALVAMGVAAYYGDRAMTRWAQDAWITGKADWLDRTGLGTVDYLELPGASPHYGYIAETWNRNFGQTLLLGVGDPDPFADHRVNIASDGRLLLDGRKPGPRVVAVNTFGTDVRLDGTVVARPQPGLVVYRLGASPHVRSMAYGLYHDRWASQVRYQVWPASAAPAGTYRVRLALPAGYKARQVTLKAGGAVRTVSVAGGETVDVQVPVRRFPVPALHVSADHFDYVGAFTPNPRLVGIRIPRLEFVPSPQGSA